MTTWLDCPVCGTDLFESDEDGKFWTDTAAVCTGCATICWIDVDDSDCDLDDEDDSGVATVFTFEDIADVGQPRCDGSCGLSTMTSGFCPIDGGCPRGDGFGPVVELEVLVGEEPSP